MTNILCQQLKGKRYWLLGTGITMFLIRSYMFVNYIAGLCILVCQQNIFVPGNFTFEGLARGISNFYSCPKSWFNDPPCISHILAGETVMLMHEIMWAVWLTGISLITYSMSKMVAAGRKLSGEQEVK